MGDAKGFGDIMKQLMDMLKQAMQKKGGGGGGQQQQQQNQQGCTSYYQVSTPTTDPCAYYVPKTSDSLTGNQLTGGTSGNISSDLLKALTGGSGSGLGAGSEEGLGDESGDTSNQSNVSGLLNENADQGSGSEEQNSGSTSTTSGSAENTSLSNEQIKLGSSTRGDIELRGKSATFFAGSRDTGANTEVAGFYGSDTLGGEPKGLVAKMCRSRPWANSIVTYIIPPSFFDNLCAWRGYQIGEPAPSPTPPAQKKTSKPAVSASTSSPSKVSLPSVKPEVDIWAVPEKVPLGTRTSIFWNSRGVESCKVTSPDGNFNETSLSGGAATVPLSGSTTFSILCHTSEGAEVTDSVTVELAI